MILFWVHYYQMFANKLLEYMSNRPTLIEKIKNVFKKCDMPLPKLEEDDNIEDINPFAVFALFNRGLSKNNKDKLIKSISEEFQLSDWNSDEFYGIREMAPNNYLFCSFRSDRGENDIDNLWQLFKAAIEYADEKTYEAERRFITYFDIVQTQKCVLENITTGLYWIRPYEFLSLTPKNKEALEESSIKTDFSKALGGKEYLKLIKECKKKIAHKFPELTHRAQNGYELLEWDTEEDMTDIEKNTILYGPPGTGKTYSSVIYAVAIIENVPLDTVMEEAQNNYKDVLKRYNIYKEQGLIAFTTFHQSMGYEEFIEGIRPVMNDASGELRYRVEPGIFKAFCENASPVGTVNTEDMGLNENPTVWKVSLGKSHEVDFRQECMDNDYIRIGYYDPATNDSANAFMNKMRIGDIVFIRCSPVEINAIGVITGDAQYREDLNSYHNTRTVNWILKGITENIVSINRGKKISDQTVHKLNVSAEDALNIVRKYTDRKNRVFIIDEINRGNISKIFGELITLIEPSKRVGSDEAMRITLPYSREEFGVPDNVYIIGTMNTADRSIAAIDTALRRRFDFCEMLPDTDTLEDCYVEDISIKELLDTMNKRISVLYDREHTIGHAYFIPLLKDNSIDKLGEIFEKKVIPLLQEYFYEDYGKIRLVLGDNRKTEDAQFITKNEEDYIELFGSDTEEFDEIETYSINADAFYNIDSYKI